jgi:hypothetical protein
MLRFRMRARLIALPEIDLFNLAFQARGRRTKHYVKAQSERASHGTSWACARRVESEPVKRDEPLAVKIRPEVSPRKDKRDGNAPHPTP